MLLIGRIGDGGINSYLVIDIQVGENSVADTLVGVSHATFISVA
jgi:hypothetical protein